MKQTSVKNNNGLILEFLIVNYVNGMNDSTCEQRSFEVITI